MGTVVKRTMHPSVEDLKKASDAAFEKKVAYEKQLVDAYKDKKLKSRRLIVEAKAIAGGIVNE